MKRMDNLRPWLLRLSKADMLMPLCRCFANDVYDPSSNISAPFIQGGLTGLLLGVEQDATLQNLQESYTSMSSHFGSLICV
jgi:hypothetical protein